MMGRPSDSLSALTSNMKCLNEHAQALHVHFNGHGDQQSARVLNVVESTDERIVAHSIAWSQVKLVD
jgi:ribosomal protein S15P/S13E